MKKVFLILLPLIVLSGIILGQNTLNGRFIRQDIYGHVYFETPVLNYLSELQSFFKESGRSLKINITEFEISEFGDSTGYSYSRINSNSEIFNPLLYKHNAFYDQALPYPHPEIDDMPATTAKNNIKLNAGDYYGWTIKANKHGQVISIKNKAKISDVTDRNPLWNFNYKNGKIKNITVYQYDYKYDEHGKEIFIPIRTDLEYEMGLLTSEISYKGKEAPESPYLCADSLREVILKGRGWEWNYLYGTSIIAHFTKIGLQEITFCVYNKGVLKEILFWSTKSSAMHLIVEYDESGKISSVSDHQSKTKYVYDQKNNRLLQRIFLEQRYDVNQSIWEIDEKTLDLDREETESYYYDHLNRIIKTTGQKVTISKHDIMNPRTYKRNGKILNYSLKQP